jgi:hypothetical protein
LREPRAFSPFRSLGGVVIDSLSSVEEGYLEEDHPIKSSPLRLTSFRGVGDKRWSDLLGPPRPQQGMGEYGRAMGGPIVQRRTRMGE